MKYSTAVFGKKQVTWGHNITGGQGHPTLTPNTQTYTKRIKNARFREFQLDHHDGSTEGPTDGPMDGRTKPLIELLVRN